MDQSWLTFGPQSSARRQLKVLALSRLWNDWLSTRDKFYLNCQIIKFKVTQVFTQVAYEQEDYYHSVQWLEESVRLFRGTGSKWSPENEGTLQDALDHLAFSHFKVGVRKLGTCTFVR